MRSIGLRDRLSRAIQRARFSRPLRSQPHDVAPPQVTEEAFPCGNLPPSKNVSAIVWPISASVSRTPKFTPRAASGAGGYDGPSDLSVPETHATLLLTEMGRG